MSNTKYIELLQMAFRDLHSCEAKHLETVPIHETFQGKTAWEGEVEVFALTGHKKATKGYAWSYLEDGENKITAVLEIPPVTSPKTAVQVSILAAARNKA